MFFLCTLFIMWNSHYWHDSCFMFSDVVLGAFFYLGLFLCTIHIPRTDRRLHASNTDFSISFQFCCNTDITTEGRWFRLWWLRSDPSQAKLPLNPLLLSYILSQFNHWVKLSAEYKYKCVRALSVVRYLVCLKVFRE